MQQTTINFDYRYIGSKALLLHDLQQTSDIGFFLFSQSPLAFHFLHDLCLSSHLVSLQSNVLAVVLGYDVVLFKGCDVCATVGGVVLGVVDVTGCKILGVVVSRERGGFRLSKDVGVTIGDEVCNSVDVFGGKFPGVVVSSGSGGGAVFNDVAAFAENALGVVGLSGIGGCRLSTGVDR